MFNKAAFFIGLRYTRAKRKNHFISFISLVSMLGIALGITVLITVLSVMNGFDQEIQKRIFSMVPPMTITGGEDQLANWQDVQTSLQPFKILTGSAPFISGQVLLNNGSAVQPALLNGIDPNQENKISQIPDKMVTGDFSALLPGKFGVILGQTLAYTLDVRLGDKVTIVTPQVSYSPAGLMPRYKRFTVVGIFSAGNAWNFDRGYAYINLSDAQRLLGLPSNVVNGLHVNTPNVFLAPSIAQNLMMQLSPELKVTTWTDQFGDFFSAVRLEKNMMFFILMLIIAVAAFNLVSTLMMVVNEKEPDIAILRTFGATPKTVMAIFIVQGTFVGLLGVLLGLIGGLLLASNVTEIVNGLQKFLHVQIFAPNVYFVSYLPSVIQLSDILKICSIAFLMSLLATIYPSWRAAKLDPVESLRYE